MSPLFSDLPFSPLLCHDYADYAAAADGAAAFPAPATLPPFTLFFFADC